MSTLERISELRAEAESAIVAAPGTAELEELRVRYLGRKAELTSILRGIAELPAPERGPVGKDGNVARSALEELLASRRDQLDAAEIESRLGEDRIDVTLPGAPAAATGSRNLLLRTMREIEDVFVGLGYRVMEGPEVEFDYYNFTALNHPPGHPARMAQDTFYIDPATCSAPAPSQESDRGAQSLPRSQAAGESPAWESQVLLRTHTSPMQVRSMEAQGPPIFIVVPGRCYRSDPFDATHSPVFHQVEGLAVGEGITLADLKGTLDELARAIFGPERETRFRPGFFPFTEPSVEVDVSCFRCDATGTLPDGRTIAAASPPDQPVPAPDGTGQPRCSLCKGSGWIEILGAGMVDPNVFGFVAASGYDPDRVQGFAFGMGIERIALLKHGVPDLRKFFENDVRVLEQFR